jgi:hypothetical protein
MLLLRKLLFLSFLIAYIIICPLLVLYALGYIYSPVKQELVHTGILHLTSIPSDADIYMEKSHFSSNTPATIQELLPGSYKITLRKKGYKPWIHSITIEAGKAIAFRNILLIPNNWPQENITTHGCKNLIDIENEQLFIVTTGSNLDSFFVYNMDGKIRPLLPFRSPFFSLPAAKVFYEAKSDAIVVCAGPGSNRKYLYLNLEDKNTGAIDITKLIPEEPSFITWQGQKEPDLFTWQKNCINLIEVRKEKTYPCYLENIKGFGIYDEGLFIIDQNDALIYQALDTRKQKNLSEDMHLSERLFSRSEFYHIKARNDKTIFLLGTKGDFIVNLPPYYFAAKDVVGYSFGSNPDLLLYWTKTSLSIVDFSVGRDKTVSHENFKVQTIYDNGRNLKQVLWADEDSHILCNDADSIYLIELLPQGPVHVEFILKVKNNIKTFYDNGENALYYLDDKDGVLKRLQIIPKQPITISPFRTRN